ncbi:MAG: hypothetical protein ABII00_12415 [Elusimicrobiota bacterium]
MSSSLRKTFSVILAGALLAGAPGTGFYDALANVQVAGAIKAPMGAVPAAVGGIQFSGAGRLSQASAHDSGIALGAVLPSISLLQPDLPVSPTGIAPAAASPITAVRTVSSVQALTEAKAKSAIASSPMFQAVAASRDASAGKTAAASRTSGESFAASSGALFDGSAAREGQVAPAGDSVLSETGRGISESGRGIKLDASRSPAGAHDQDDAVDAKRKLIDRISRHRWGLFARRSEKGYALLSLMGAGGAALFTGWRYLTAGTGTFIDHVLGVKGLYYFNDFITPLGILAAGYLISVAWSLRRYRRMHPDERSGRLVRTAITELPLFAVSGSLAYEVMQSGLFKSLAGFGIPGSFSPGDVVAYLAGGALAVMLGKALWVPYGSRRSKRRKPVPPFITGLQVGIPAALALYAAILLKSLDPGFALAMLAIAAVIGPLMIYAAVISLHKATKALKKRWLISHGILTSRK